MWLLAIAFVWAGGFIAARVTSALVWAPVLTGAVLLSLSRLLTAYADVPLGFYLALGTLQLGVWLQSGRRRDLALAALLLAGAAAVKNEGTAGALLVLAVALAAMVFARRRRAALELALASALLGVVAILPWRLWVAAHHLQTEVPLGRVANPGFLARNVDRVGPVVHGLDQQLGMTNGVTIFVSLALAMVAACAWERRGRTLGAFYLVVLAGYYATLVWSWWIDTLPLSFMGPATAGRLDLGLGFIAVAAVLHLSGAHGRLGAPGLSPPGAGAERRSA
jgi:hypothetical protein